MAEETADVAAEVGRELDEERAERLRSAGYDSLDDLVEAAARQMREQAMPKATWAEFEEALTALGSEDHIARRLKALRRQAGLSQEKLAERLEALGVQMPQSSISKIEVPVEAKKGKRRDITVDEALALAKALDVPLTELLLPDDALADLRLHRILGEGSELWQRRNGAQLDYDYAVEQLAEAACQKPEWLQRLADELQQLLLSETGVDDEGRYHLGLPLPTPTSLARRYFVEDVLRSAADLGRAGGEEGS